MKGDGRNPWHLSSSGGTVLRGEDGLMSLEPGGVTCTDAEQRVEVPWVDVTRLDVSLPILPKWRWLLQAPLFLLVPSALMRPPEINVMIWSRKRNYQLHLGRPGQAPYPKGLASATDALCQLLSEEGQLAAFGDPAKAPRLLDALATLATDGSAPARRRQRLKALVSEVISEREGS